MKKIISLLLVLFLTWCTLDDKKWAIENKIITDNTWTIVSWEQNQSAVNPYPSYDDGWELLSGELFWSWKYSTLTLSGWVLNYDNIFTLKIDVSDYNHWDYYANQDLLLWTYREAWFINVQNQQRHNTINISKPDSSVSYILSEGASDEEKCSVSRDEWQTIIKPLMKEQNWQSYYVIEEKFRSPSMEVGGSEIHNYQINLCFVKNNVVYTLIVWNSDWYKKDIIDSIQFL